jgi:hypothetical protein
MKDQLVRCPCGCVVQRHPSEPVAPKLCGDCLLEHPERLLEGPRTAYTLSERARLQQAIERH